jgi:hypothetical protein
MAVYKVPQDVEAEDKLIGPFSFRQFIYLIIAALGILMAWLLSRIFIGLFVLPLPIVVAFLALALPLRKDQPMETYLIAMIKFFFKPRKRLWDPEGTISLVQITALKVTEGPQMKGYDASEASQRLAYLAQVVDTQGWSTRGATLNQNLSDIIVAEANQVEDVLDEQGGVAQAFEQRIAQADDARLQAVRQQMQASAATQEPVQQTPTTTQTQNDTPPADITFNPYPADMHQRVLSPTKPARPAPAPTPQPEPTENKASAQAVSPDIMRLANNNDLSISALAHEAHRLKDNDGEEVVISLR